MDLNLVDQIRSTFNALPDCRKQGNNQKYAVEDAALSAFSVFFTQRAVTPTYRTAVRIAASPPAYAKTRTSFPTNKDRTDIFCKNPNKNAAILDRKL
jgi:hypothetical protein